ncbi:MAG: hypothetical protein K1X81_03480 [Bacteroidia bacterium]|nr:hypothetical protein [Bacteroidia bacterium]
MKNYLYLICLVSISASGQQTSKSPKFLVYASLQVINRPTTFGPEPSGVNMHTPSIVSFYRERNTGFGINGGVELKYNPWQLAFTIGATGRVAKLYDAFRIEEKRDSTGKLISSRFDYNKWAPVMDIHIEITKYIKLKNENLLYFSLGTNEFFRGTKVAGQWDFAPDSVNRDIRIIGYFFSSNAMNLRTGILRKNVTASFGLYFPGINLGNLEFYGSLKSFIPEFRLGYRFKVL